MSARFANPGMFRADAVAEGRNGVGLLARVGGAFTAIGRYVAELPARRAVINELSTLSDRELADIGLARSDVRRVFDDAFVAGRRGAI